MAESATIERPTDNDGGRELPPDLLPTSDNSGDHDYVEQGALELEFFANGYQMVALYGGTRAIDGFNAASRKQSVGMDVGRMIPRAIMPRFDQEISYPDLPKSA